MRKSEAHEVQVEVDVTGWARATVKWHIREIYLKLGLTRQMELARSVAEIPRLPCWARGSF